MSVLLKCLLQPCSGVLHVPVVISVLDSKQELIEIDHKEDNFFYELHTHGISSLDFISKSNSVIIYWLYTNLENSRTH